MSEKKASKIQLAREAAADMIAAHKDALTIKNAGKLLGKGAFKAVKPFIALYDGAKEGFKNGQ